MHVIDLDGAFGSGENLSAVERICKAVDVPVQTGGGLRAVKHAEDAFAAGAAEIILGTLFVEDERLARHIISRFPGKVIAGIDARGSQVATHGWQERTPVDRDALVRRVAQWGVPRIIFTEIRRDGMGEGYDIDALNAVANAAEVKVTASGGARNIDDLKMLKRIRSGDRGLVHRRQRALQRHDRPSRSDRRRRLRCVYSTYSRGSSAGRRVTIS